VGNCRGVIGFPKSDKNRQAIFLLASLTAL